MFSCPARVFLKLVCCLTALLVAQDAHAAFGQIVAQFDFPASSFVMMPAQPLMYATIPSQNSVAIINTNTLAVESLVFVGSGPVNLAFSPDASRAYIANSTSNFVAVFDTQARAVINSFSLPEEPQDVVFGTQNRLWVLGQGQIFQIDATTGASTGPSIGGFVVYGGSLEISPDRNTLYYANYGLSPGTMYKYNVSGTTPVLVLETPFGTAGSNGQDLTLSHDGSFICYATGSGQNLYDIAKFRTSDFASLGSFNTGPYPRAAAFSADDSVVFASVDTGSGIQVFNANTFLSFGTISGPEVATKLAVDSRDRYLFAGYNAFFGDFTGTIVFDIRRPNIIPGGDLPGGNTAEGYLALNGLTSGIYNSAFGIFSLLSNGAANFNTGVGAGALLKNLANENTGVGSGALFGNTTGAKNTGLGAFALFSNTTGEINNAVGADSLLFNTDGARNNAFGTSALSSNISGSYNTAIGDVALANNDLSGTGSGSFNTAVGAGALFANVDGDSNNALGFSALGANVDGRSNNAIGFDAMGDNVHGVGNVAIGNSAGAGVEGDFNIYIGAFAGPAPSPAPVTESETIRIGDASKVACFIGGISGVAVSGDPVVVDANGQLGVAPAGSRLPANELLKQKRLVQELKATAEKQAATMALQEGQIKALTTSLKQHAEQIRKASAQLERSEPAPRTFLNSQ